MIDRTVIGLTEKVKIWGGTGKKETVKAKIDTGASKSSIDLNLAAKLNVGPVIKSKIIKSALGKRLRPVVIAEIEIAGKKINGQFTLADRTEMKYQVLIGANILKKGFLIDPLK